jgi:hypothetical protein
MISKVTKDNIPVKDFLKTIFLEHLKKKCKNIFLFEYIKMNIK